MLIRCPRCGFSQPDDQYCAQCGVNMQSFKPVPKSIFKKLFESLAFQVLVLVIIAGFAGNYVIRSESSPRWVQKLSRIQAMRKTSPTTTATQSTEGASTVEEELARNQLNELTQQELILENETDATPATSTVRSAPEAVASATSGRLSESTNRTQDSGAAETSPILFKVIFVEVSLEVLNRWIAESSRLGLFQSLPQYSAGILPDFKKRNDPITQYLKTAEKKLSIGQSEAHLSGIVNDEGQMVGLSVFYDFKSFEAGTIHGSIQVTRAFQQPRETFPAEFDLPKGSVFFMVDTMTRMTFPPEQLLPSMAPFQIYKSNDFLSQKSKFVIILEPDIR